MKILIVHNQYQQPGGEDAVVKDEFNLLRGLGEDAHLYERSNKEFNKVSGLRRLRALSGMGWSRTSYQEMRTVLQRIRPDVVHFHNIFYVLTPSVYQACKDEGVPVVQSLHNFRLLCSNALLFRENKICEKCVEKKNLNWGIYHRCYRKSRWVTAMIVRMLKRHWQEGTWSNMVDHYIMASEFGRQKYIAAGIPEEKISVKPHVVYSDVFPHNQDKKYALYVGRLSEEKGVRVLLEAWKRIQGLTLKIAGDGPLAADLRRYAKEHNIINVEFLGFISDVQYRTCMQGAKFLVVPSVCYENFPRIVVEAYAYGIPVVASALGSLPEIVIERQTGLLFTSGNAQDLAEKVQWVLAHEDELDAMRRHIQEQYTEKYSTRRNYEILMGVYRKVLEGPEQAISA